MKPINPKDEKEKIIKFIRETLKKQGFKNVVIGVSGGIDSTVSLYLLKETIPARNIIAIHLPYLESHEKKLKKVFNIKTISLKPFLSEDVFFELFKEPMSREEISSKARNKISSEKKIRLGNITARLRMIILYDFAKKYNALVCGTENRTEQLLGYFTRFGDAASDFEPIQHLYKTQVYQLAKYLRLPNEFIEQKPTAGLWQGQTDEGEFGFSYEEADNVLSLYFDNKKTVEQIEKLGCKNTRKILDFGKKNSFKRETPYIL